MEKRFKWRRSYIYLCMKKQQQKHPILNVFFTETTNISKVLKFNLIRFYLKLTRTNVLES